MHQDIALVHWLQSIRDFRLGLLGMIKEYYLYSCGMINQSTNDVHYNGVFTNHQQHHH